MKTLDYNPSLLEVEFAKVISEMTSQIQQKMSDVSIVKVEENLKLDNPRLKFTLKDQDGDVHNVVVHVIQSMDSF
jgi:hypothetical protein